MQKNNSFFSYIKLLVLSSCYYFHSDAEDILQHEVQGCFLVRLSERVVGYILSYKWVLGYSKQAVQLL